MKAPRSSSAYQHAKLTRVDDQRLRDQQLARVRFLIAEVLRDEGIEVMEVGHAQAALDSLEQHAARIHVLFTDIQMPGPMDGLALAHHTSKNWPWIRLLITSARPPPHRIVFPAKGRFVMKPYRHSQVVRHIRELA